MLQDTAAGVSAIVGKGQDEVSYPMAVLRFQFWTTARQEMLVLNRATNRFEPDAELRLKVFFCDEKMQPFISYVAVVPPYRKLPDDDEDVFEKIEQRPPEIGILTFRQLPREERE